MKLTILGNHGPYPNGGGACSGYLVEDGDTRILLDMGSGTLGRLLSLIKLESLTAIVITHSHFDHTSDLLPFRYLLESLNLKITLFAREDGTEWSKFLFSHPNFNLAPYFEGADFSTGGLKLKFYKTEHPAVNYAVSIEGSKKLFYTGDARLTEALINAAAGADCILADCCQKEGFVGGHMSVDQGVELQRRTGSRLIATHLSPLYDPAEYFAPYTMITVGEEMRCYQI